MLLLLLTRFLVPLNRDVPPWVRTYLSRGRHAIQAEVYGVAELQVVGEDDPRAMPVAIAVHLGIKLLETSRGQAKLLGMGWRIVNHSDLYQYILDPSKHDMNEVVSDFLEKLRQQTPSIILSRRMKDPVYLCKSTFTEVWRDLNEWSPRDNLEIYVNGDVRSHVARPLFPLADVVPVILACHSFGQRLGLPHRSRRASICRQRRISSGSVYI
jgi:hypothetical protein